MKLKRLEREAADGFIASGHTEADLAALPREPLLMDGPVLVTLADVEAEDVEYVWRPRIPRGKLTLIAGDPGGGKTYVTSGDMAARISRGLCWPDGGRAPLGSVLILTAEDGPADTLRPRLERCGGDPSRVHVLQGVRVDGDARHFNLEHDLTMLEGALVSTAAIAAFVDPLSAYLGSKNSHVDSELRGLLSPLALLAERRRVAIVAILHLTKAQTARLAMRVQGSVAFLAQARSALAVGPDPEAPERRLFAHIKNNLGPQAPTLAFRISDAGLTWDDGIVEGGADRLLAATDVLSRGEVTERDEAVTFLRRELSEGPVPSKTVEADAKANGISQRTLWRAKAALKITARRLPGARGAWFWSLPETEP